MASFEEVTRSERGVWGVPDGWQQGRGAFGGLTLATLARAASEALGDPGRPLRSITAEIPGAVVAGEARVCADTLRSGTGMSTVAARAEQGGGVVAHAVCVFGKARPVDRDRLDLSPPRAPPPGEVPVELREGLVPAFARHVEYRPLTGGVPFSGARDAVVEGYVRLRDPGAIEPSLALVALVDAWWPAVMTVGMTPRPFGTISFSAQLFRHPFTLTEPLLHRGKNLVTFEGFSVEQRELWTPRGDLVALNHQTIALIK